MDTFGDIISLCGRARVAGACRSAGVIAFAVLLSSCAVHPDPMTLDQHVARARADVGHLLFKSRPTEKDLTLADAVARGLSDNLDQRLAMMEQTLAESRLSLVNYDMLPSLAVNAGYNARDRYAASESKSLQSGTTSLEPSYSSEKTGVTADLGFSWNLLDFGIGYFQAKQQADAASAAVEVRRRVINTTTRDIISAYYRAQYAQHLLPRVEEAIGRADRALDASDKIRKEQLVPAQQMLSYKRDMLQSLLTLKNLRGELMRARQELATLINVPVDDKLKIADMAPADLPPVAPKLGALQDHALVYRAELREEAYKERSDRQAVYQETLKMFPGLSAIASLNYDSNQYLYYNDWRELGLRATWNLLDVAKAVKSRDIAQMQVEYAQMKRLALTAAVLAQTSISYYQYEEARNSYGTAQKLSDVEGKLLKSARDNEKASTGSRLETVRQEVASLDAAIAAGRQYAEGQAALAGLMVSVGYDLVPPGFDDKDPDALSQNIAPALDELMQGRLAAIDDTPPVLEQPTPPAPEKKSGGFWSSLFGHEETPEAPAKPTESAAAVKPADIAWVEAAPVAPVEAENVTAPVRAATSTPVPAPAPETAMAQEAPTPALQDTPIPQAVPTIAEAAPGPLATPAQEQDRLQSLAAKEEPVAPAPAAAKQPEVSAPVSVASAAPPSAVPAAPIAASPSDCIIAPAGDEGDSDAFLNKLKRRFFGKELKCQ